MLLDELAASIKKKIGPRAGMKKAGMTPAYPL
jgi:hypothetical protein